MALYVLFENENTFLFLYCIWLLLNLQMCQIILPDPVELSFLHLQHLGNMSNLCLCMLFLFVIQTQQWYGNNQGRSHCLVVTSF